MSPEKKFDCYKCKFRGTIPGDAHSCCNYPGTSADVVDFVLGKNSHIAKKLNIRGNAHGVRNGWFMWPVNFDPVWLGAVRGQVTF